MLTDCRWVAVVLRLQVVNLPLSTGIHHAQGSVSSQRNRENYRLQFALGRHSASAAHVDDRGRRGTSQVERPRLARCEAPIGEARLARICSAPQA